MQRLKQKEENLRDWQTQLSNREYKIESGKDIMCSLMREICIKDSLLVEKDVLISKKDRDMDDVRRECREDVLREVEVCEFIMCVSVLIV